MTKEKVELLTALTIKYAEEIESLEELEICLNDFKSVVIKTYLKKRGINTEALNNDTIKAIIKLGEKVC